MRKRIARHIESCPKCNDERHRLVTPAALLGAAPAFIPAPARLRQQTLDEIQLPVTTTDGGSEATSTGRGRKGLFAVALLFAVVGASGGLAYLALHGQSVEIAPAEITKTLPVPSPPPTATKTPSVQPGAGAPSPRSPRRCRLSTPGRRRFSSPSPKRTRSIRPRAIPSCRNPGRTRRGTGMARTRNPIRRPNVRYPTGLPAARRTRDRSRRGGPRTIRPCQGTTTPVTAVAGPVRHGEVSPGRSPAEKRSREK
jgi:hypothetical protein